VKDLLPPIVALALGGCLAFLLVCLVKPDSRARECRNFEKYTTRETFEYDGRTVTGPVTHTRCVAWYQRGVE
jgi:hypothetical protein